MRLCRFPPLKNLRAFCVAARHLSFKLAADELCLTPSAVSHQMRELETTLVLYESPHRIVAALEAIGEIFGATDIVVARELTKQFEEIVRAPAAAHLERLRDNPPRGEFVVIIPRA